MSGNNVDIKISGNDLDSLNMWKRQYRENDRLHNKIDKLGKAGKQSGKELKTGFDGALVSAKEFSGTLLGTTSIIGGVALGVNQVRMELEHLKRLNKQDADAQVPFQDALVQAFKNSGGKLMEPAELEKLVAKIEKETGVSQTKVALSLSSAFSSRGPTNKAELQEAVEATIASLKFSPANNAQELSDLTGAGIDLSKRFGFSPTESLGYLQNVSGQARVDNPAMMANNATPAIANLANYGNTATEAGALIAALTQGATDKTAAMTGTSAISLAAQLRERGIGKSTAEGIELLAADPELRKRFLEGGEFGPKDKAGKRKKYPKASFEKNASVAIQQLFEPGSVTREAYLGAKSVIGGNKEAQQAYDMMTKAAKLLAPTSETRRRSIAAAESAHIADTRGAATSEAMDAVSRSMDAANFGWLRKKAVGWELDSKFAASDKDPRLVAAEVLRLEKDRLLQRGPLDGVGVGFDNTALEGANFAAGGFVKPHKVRNPLIPEQDRAAAELMQRQIVILLDAVQTERDKNKSNDRAIKATEENTKAMQEVAKALKQPSPATATVPPRRREPFRSPAESLGVSRDR